jgi:hypothetical protein
MRKVAVAVGKRHVTEQRAALRVRARDDRTRVVVNLAASSSRAHAHRSPFITSGTSLRGSPQRSVGSHTASTRRSRVELFVRQVESIGTSGVRAFAPSGRIRRPRRPIASRNPLPALLLVHAARRPAPIPRVAT